MSGQFITDAPKVTADSFVDYLTSDDTLVHFFNEFLSLPSFSQAVTYNRQTGVFEEVSDAAESLSRTIHSALKHCKSKLFSDPSWLTATPLVDNHYSVLYLDQNQGLQWILKERLPFFIQSDCYFEYRLWAHHRCIYDVSPRLAKLLSLRDPRCQGLGVRDSSGASVQSPLTQGEEEKGEPLTPPIQGPTVYLTEAATAGCCYRDCKCHSPSRGPLDHLAASLVAEVLRDVGTEMDDYLNLSEKRAETTYECCIQSEQRTVANRCGMGVSSEMDRGIKLKEGGRMGADQEHDLDAGFHVASIYGSRQGIEEFKAFLRGTPGEKMLGLWMDIERLKTMEDDDPKHRHLIQMRQCYLLSSTGEARLSVELLSRLGLATSPCWREDKLYPIQPCITQALLLYWGPRFLSARSGSEDGQECDLRLREKRQLRPPSGIDPSPRCVTLHPLRPVTCFPSALTSADPQPGGPSCSPSPVLGGRRMERMLTALHVDPQAGHFFTGFCERSGNQLWHNAALCWWDLQQYHTLFYQDGLDPYRVKRLAQMLYSTYVCSAAQRGVGVVEEIRRRVYQCLSPPFEELFDGVEEHILALLLEPWTLLQSRDTHSYQRVCVREETRQVDSEQYRELQTLYREAEHRRFLVQQQGTSALPPPEGPKAPDSWDKVPERYRRYRLGSLLRHRMELDHFLSFLEEHAASIHLTCWLDVDQLRRTPQKDKVTREERSKDIKTKYLNRKYLFGTGSPASAEQQEDLLRLAGGWGRLQQGRLSGAVLVEVQNIVRGYLEKEWLPLFLATPQFYQRQTLKPQAADSVSDQVYQRHRKKREVWKADGSRMSSSQEVLALRRTLLHPFTCLQFQTFVSLKGHFLENDVLFWMEVQRYKDLCHSHCDEAVVQNKVSTIISCFLNSSVPPAVQVDVPPEQVQNILERRAELGPYVFREAQMSVFSELLKLWPQFQAFRSGVEEEEVLPLLEKRRRKQRERLLRRRRREEEEEKKKEEQEQGALSEEEEEEEEEDRLTGQTGRQSRELSYPSQQMAWSYSMYMMALEREELLLRRHAHLEQGGASDSTVSDSLSCPSVRSAGSRPRHSILSPRADSAPLPNMK
ncbi:regulator of G-protein signaling 22 isoform X2 [Osmerus eperlanus]|uniref:regulator of G-protein signaling 22 isoform X2 n=1 Tax=Osmerus eperlanus TaxID=29151 RepID=UPI002E12FF9B